MNAWGVRMGWGRDLVDAQQKRCKVGSREDIAGLTGTNAVSQKLFVVRGKLSLTCHVRKAQKNRSRQWKDFLSVNFSVLA